MSTKVEKMMVGDSGVGEDEEERMLVESLINSICEENTLEGIKALEDLSTRLQTATSSISTVPRPLKLARAHFVRLARRHENLNQTDDFARSLAGILSLLASTIGDPSKETKESKDSEVPKSVVKEYFNKKETDDEVFSATMKTCDNLVFPNLALKYCLRALPFDIISWGPEYVRSLVGEILEEYENRLKNNEKGTYKLYTNDEIKKEEIIDNSDIYNLIDKIVPHFIETSAEWDAIDLLCETDHLSTLLSLINDVTTAQRCANYLVHLNTYETNALYIVYEIYYKYNLYVDAVRIGIKLNSNILISAILRKCNKSEILQSAFLLHRHSLPFNFHTLTSPNEEIPDIPLSPDFLTNEIIPSLKLEINSELLSQIIEVIESDFFSKIFLLLAKELDVLEPKTPHDVYKSHLEESQYRATVSRSGTYSPDTNKQNLAMSFVNAFVNIGYCNDKLLLGDNKTPGAWVYKNKDYGIFSTVGSMGGIMMWNVMKGIEAIDQYQYSNDNNVKGGAFLGFGLMAVNCRSDCDAIFALIAEALDNEAITTVEKLGGILGLGFAYAGTSRQDILEILVPSIADPCNTEEISCVASIALSLVFIGTGDEIVRDVILSTIIEKNGLDRNINSEAIFYSLALGILHFGVKGGCDTGDAGPFTEAIVKTFAAIGTGDETMIQENLSNLIFENKEKSRWGDMTNTKGSKDSIKNYEYMTYVLSLALISNGDDVSKCMCQRLTAHILQYAAAPARRAVPLAIALLFISNPDPSVIETLSKLTHEADSELAINAILALGIVAAGSNNSKVAQMLRILAGYYNKDPHALFMVRISQGLVHLGKGLVGLNFNHSDGLLTNPVALAGICVVLFSAFDIKATILNNQHYFLFFLLFAAFPRMVHTVDENLQPIHPTVKVGTAIPISSQAGQKLRKITGFQTHAAPVLLSPADRVELAADNYKPVFDILEGVVILKSDN